jgi:DNA-binding PadR family transcriptional regulator
MPIKRVTMALLLLAGELLRKPLEERWGYELSQETGLAPGTIQPILTRLEAEGWLDVRWEPVGRALEEGRRPRRLYRLTGAGAAAAQVLLDERGKRMPLLRSAATGATG